MQPSPDGHIGLKEIQFWADESARYKYLVNYATDEEERALILDSECGEVIYGIRREGTGVYCEVERREVKNDSKFIYDTN